MYGNGGGTNSRIIEYSPEKRKEMDEKFKPGDIVLIKVSAENSPTRSKSTPPKKPAISRNDRALSLSRTRNFGKASSNVNTSGPCNNFQPQSTPQFSTQAQLQTPDRMRVKSELVGYDVNGTTLDGYILEYEDGRTYVGDVGEAFQLEIKLGRAY